MYFGKALILISKSLGEDLKASVIWVLFYKHLHAFLAKENRREEKKEILKERKKREDINIKTKDSFQKGVFTMTHSGIITSIMCIQSSLFRSVWSALYGFTVGTFRFARRQWGLLRSTSF